MENKANKSTEVQYISAEQAADIYGKIESYIAEELDALEKALMSEINETLLNWLSKVDADAYIKLLTDRKNEDNNTVDL